MIGTADFLRAHILVRRSRGSSSSRSSSRAGARPRPGRVGWDALLLKLPLVGGILRQFALSQFTRSLATLVGAGTPLVPALEIAAGAVANRRIAGAVAAVVPRVREGAEVWRTPRGDGACSRR